MIIIKISFAYHEIKTCPPCPNNSSSTSYKQEELQEQAIPSHSGAGPTTRHPQPHKNRRHD